MLPQCLHGVKYPNPEILKWNSCVSVAVPVFKAAVSCKRFKRCSQAGEIEMVWDLGSLLSTIERQNEVLGFLEPGKEGPMYNSATIMHRACCSSHPIVKCKRQLHSVSCWTGVAMGLEEALHFSSLVLHSITPTLRRAWKEWPPANLPPRAGSS